MLWGILPHWVFNKVNRFLKRSERRLKDSSIVFIKLKDSSLRSERR